MSRKKKESSPKSAPKATATPLLEEKKNFLMKAGEFANTVIPPGFRRDMMRFGTIALFVVPGILVVSATLVGTDMLLHGRIMPGTSIGKSSIGFMYAGEAATVLQKAADTYLQTPVTFTVNGTQAQATPLELGVRFSLQQSTMSLPTYDLRKNSVVSLAFAALAGYRAEPFMTFDSEKAQTVVEQKLGIQKLRAQNAHINFDDKKNPAVIAEVPGKMLDRNELARGLSKSIAKLDPSNITVGLIEEHPAITASDLEPQKKLVAEALKSPMVLLYEGRQWKFDPSKHLDAVTFTQSSAITLKNINLILPVALNNPGEVTPNENIILAATPNMTLDEQKINSFLQDEIISKIDHPTSDVKIYTDDKKKIVVEGKGQNGVRVSRQGLLASLNLALSKNIKRVEVPALETKANVTVSDDLQNLGIKNLIATGHTAFAGSHAGRVKNIQVGVSRYNGLLVGKGETFSFNDHLGPVDGQHGFVQELVIKAEGTVPDYGGGLCQVSSTLYQAALFAGFPIVERANHSYAVSYYAQILGYGLDGTIYPGVHDVKFLNNSPSNLVVQAYTEGDQAYFKFYGTDDGRKVWLEGPYQSNYRAPGPTQIVQSPKLAPGARKQVEINHTGFDVTWYRHIVKDGKEDKETLFTRYDAVPAKIMVGPAAEPAGTAQASVPKT